MINHSYTAGITISATGTASISVPNIISTVHQITTIIETTTAAIKADTSLVLSTTVQGLSVQLAQILNVNPLLSSRPLCPCSFVASMIAHMRCCLHCLPPPGRPPRRA
jgi:hypothetical protein